MKIKLINKANSSLVNINNQISALPLISVTGFSATQIPDFGQGVAIKGLILQPDLKMYVLLNNPNSLAGFISVIDTTTSTIIFNIQTDGAQDPIFAATQMGELFLSSSQAGSNNVTVDAYDANGNKIWSTSYGGTNQYSFIASDFTDSNAIVGINYGNPSNGRYAILEKLDGATGSIIWQDTFNYNDYISALTVAHDNSIFVGYWIGFGPGGSTFSPWFQPGGYGISKVASDGSILWSSNFTSEIFQLSSNSDGGAVAIGFEPYLNEAEIAKYDTNGNILWDTFISGGRPYILGYGTTNCLSVDGNGNTLFIIEDFTGLTRVVALDTNGNLLWQQYASQDLSMTFQNILTAPDGSVFLSALVNPGTTTIFGLPIQDFQITTNTTSLNFVFKFSSTGSVSGSLAADTLVALTTAGGSSLSGLAGNDIIIGGTGNDTINGNSAIAAIPLASPNLNFNAASIISPEINIANYIGKFTEYNITHNLDGTWTVADKIAGRDGTDTLINIQQLQFFDVLYTLPIGATITGTAAADNLTGTAGDDSISGLAGNDTLSGLAGNDTLDGGAGNDSMLGGDGNDTYVVDSTTDVVVETNTVGGASQTDLILSSVTYTLGTNVENLTLTGTAAINATGNTLANTLTGNSGNNVLDGGAANDTLTGGAGNDSLNGGAGNDSMVGGDGNDTYVVDSTTDVVVETNAVGTNNIDLVQSAITYTLGANLENLTLTGTTAINGTGNTLNNVLTGNSGVNILDGGLGNDTMVGGAGNDTYVVDSISDVVTEALNAGTDLIQSSVTYTASANVENLTLTGTAAINATGNTLANTLTGNSGNNVLDGGAANDTLIGGLGNDSLNGGAGNDSMVGGDGNDTYVVDSTTDVVVETNSVVGSGGTDLIQSSVTYTLSANVENLTLTGTAAINGTGNALDNYIIGNTGNNSLIGGSGNDTLDGGLGNDTLSGGLGNDFYYVAANQSGSKVINDLGGTDTLNLDFSVLGLVNGASNAYYTQGYLIDFTRSGTNNVNLVATLTKSGVTVETITINNEYTNATTLNTTNAIENFGLIYVDASATLSAAGGLSTFTDKQIVAGTSVADVLTDTSTNGSLLFGGAGNDILNATGAVGGFNSGRGSDLTGGTGVDTFNMGSGLSFIEDLGNGGADNVVVSAGAGLLANIYSTGWTPTVNTTNNGSTTLSTNGYVVNLTAVTAGSAGFNVSNIGVATTLTGSALIDTLTGGSGNDTLSGRLGNDVLTGSGGSDIFLFNTATGINNIDTITDFTSGTDKINLSRAIYAGISTTATVAANQLGLHTLATPPTTSTERLFYDAASGGLYYDRDGSGTTYASVEIAILGTNSHPASLIASDFVMVA